MVQRLNQIVLFEYGAHLLMTVIFVFTMNFLEFFINLPLAGYNVWLYVPSTLPRYDHKTSKLTYLLENNIFLNICPYIDSFAHIIAG